MKSWIYLYNNIQSKSIHQKSYANLLSNNLAWNFSQYWVSSTSLYTTYLVCKAFNINTERLKQMLIIGPWVMWTMYPELWHELRVLFLLSRNINFIKEAEGGQFFSWLCLKSIFDFWRSSYGMSPLLVCLFVHRNIALIGFL